MSSDATRGRIFPYFGNIMTTAMLGSGDSARIAIVPLEKDHKAAYAAYGMGS